MAQQADAPGLVTAPHGSSRVLNAIGEIDAIQTTLLRALAGPHRLRIIHLLGEGPREVNEMARELDLAQAAVSQHLASMRSVGLVEAVRDGRCVRYQLTDPEILSACALMRAVIVRRLSALGSLAAAASLDGVGAGLRHATRHVTSSSQVPNR